MAWRGGGRARRSRVGRDSGSDRMGTRAPCHRGQVLSPSPMPFPGAVVGWEHQQARRDQEQSVLPGWCKWGPPTQLFLVGNHPVHIPMQHDGWVLSSLLCTGSKHWGGWQGKLTAGCWSCVGLGWARMAAPQPLPCPHAAAPPSLPQPASLSRGRWPRGTWPSWPPAR